MINPLTIIITLLTSGYIIMFISEKKNIGRILVLIGIVLLICFSFTPSADLIIQPLKSKYPPFYKEADPVFDKTVNTVVVLGGGHGTSMSAPAIGRMNYETMERLLEGIRLYKKIPGSRLLMSGGSTSSRTISTAEIMAQAAMELGISQNDILVEKVSRDTKDQAKAVSEILDGKRIVLVTSSTHMPRSIALFKKAGMDPIPAPTRSLQQKLFYRQPRAYFPSSINIQKVEMAFHEYLGMLWAKLRDQV